MRRPLVVLGLLTPAFCALSFFACTDQTNPSFGNASDFDAGGDSASADTGTSPNDGGHDAAADAGIQRGPLSLDFDPAGNGDPISLVWDDARATLFIADNRNNQLWTYTDEAGFAKWVKVPDDPVADDAGRTSLGQIVELPDGTLVVPRFGSGTVGTIVYAKPAAGTSGTVPNLVATRKRTALATDGNGALFGGYFITPGDGMGVVTKVTLDGGEVTYATGFDKPVAVAVSEGRLLVSEQTRGIIYSLPLDGGFDAAAPYPVFANVPSTDALTVGPNGSVITGQFKPTTDGGPVQVRQAFPDGGVTVLFPDAGLTKPQAVAYDKTNKRLFVADSNGTLIRTIKIYPVD